jgi:hypothetical protein
MGNKATGNARAGAIPALHMPIHTWAPAAEGSPDGDHLALTEVGVAAQSARETLDRKLAALADFGALWSAA